MIRKILFGAAAAGILLSAGAANAQMAVFDGSNYAQNVMTAARSLTQITNQITMLQNQAQMLVNGAKNLSNLNFSNLAALTSDLNQIQSLLNRAQGLSFSVGLTNSQYSQLYPSSFGSGFTSNAFAQSAQSQWTASAAAMQTAVQMQSQILNSITVDGVTLSQTNAKSGSAIGILQAVQATNQLLALLIKETMQSQTLRVADDRAAVSETTRSLSATASAQALRTGFSGSTQAYTPSAVQAFSQ